MLVLTTMTSLFEKCFEKAVGKAFSTVFKKRLHISCWYWTSRLLSYNIRFSTLTPEHWWLNLPRLVHLRPTSLTNPGGLNMISYDISHTPAQCTVQNSWCWIQKETVRQKSTHNQGYSWMLFHWSALLLLMTMTYDLQQHDIRFVRENMGKVTRIYMRKDLWRTWETELYRIHGTTGNEKNPAWIWSIWISALSSRTRCCRFDRAGGCARLSTNPKKSSK